MAPPAVRLCRRTAGFLIAAAKMAKIARESIAAAPIFRPGGNAVHPKQCQPVVRPHLVRDFTDKSYLIAHSIPPYFTVLGELDDPDRPQQYLEPVACFDWCALFSGVAACRRGCRR